MLELHSLGHWQLSWKHELRGFGMILNHPEGDEESVCTMQPQAKADIHAIVRFRKGEQSYLKMGFFVQYSGVPGGALN